MKKSFNEKKNSQLHQMYIWVEKFSDIKWSQNCIDFLSKHTLNSSFTIRIICTAMYVFVDGDLASNTNMQMIIKYMNASYCSFSHLFFLWSWPRRLSDHFSQIFFLGYHANPLSHHKWNIFISFSLSFCILNFFFSFVSWLVDWIAYCVFIFW